MRRAWIAATLPLALLSAMTLRGDGAGATSDAVTGSASQRSAALVAAPSAGGLVAEAPVPAALARALADTFADDVPLPEGGSFEGIRWEAAEGAFVAADIRSVLQYNAACQWARAWRDGRDVDAARTVLGDVPRWPALREGETAVVLGAAVEQLFAGSGPEATALLAECDAAHARELEYAAQRGVPAGR